MIPRGSGIGKGMAIRWLESAAMRAERAMAIVGVALLAACGRSERAPPPFFEIPPGPVATTGGNVPPAGAAAPGPPLFPSSNPSVQYFLPSHPGDVGRGASPVPRPDAATQPFYAAPPNLGPVTGYGPGGMAPIPGAPPNPPYPVGGR
jgi:hypothetical protein